MRTAVLATITCIAIAGCSEDNGVDLDELVADDAATIERVDDTTAEEDAEAFIAGDRDETLPMSVQAAAIIEDRCDTEDIDPDLCTRAATTRITGEDSGPYEPPSVQESVTTETACDYILDFGDDITSDVAGSFVGSITATNDGAQDARVRAVASWKRLGSEPVEQEKTFTVRAGETREVQFNAQALVADVSAHQSADAACDVRREITPAG